MDSSCGYTQHVRFNMLKWLSDDGKSAAIQITIHSLYTMNDRDAMQLRDNVVTRSGKTVIRPTRLNI